MAENKNSGRRPRRQRPPLSDGLARSLPRTPSRIVYDGGINRIAGFGLRLSPTARTWVLNFTVAGRERRMVLGAFPTWDVKQARVRAAELRRLVDQGHDPLEERQATRSAPAMAELLDEYEQAAKAKRSFRHDQAMIAKILRPRWGARKVASITLDDVEALHSALTKAGTPIRANRVVACASSIFRLAIRRRYISENPCRNISRNPENRRTRYLSVAELAKLISVLDVWPDPISAAAIKLLLLTGARRGELLRATWSEFDLAAGTWLKPREHCKNAKEHRLPLSAEAITVLLSLPRHNSSNLLFPNSRRRPWSEIAAWPEIRRAAGLKDVHAHDLRHSAASMMVSAGHSLELIGGVLGHSQPSTTARYSHLMDEALRRAVDGLGRAIAPNGAAI
jgi:integrase